MLRKIYTLLIIGLCMNFISCSDDNGAGLDSATPVINLPIKDLTVDLNKIDNLPVVAIIKSEAGLKEVNMQIQTNEGLVDYKTITEFYNDRVFSMSEMPEYNNTYEAIIIKATDQLEREEKATINVSVIDVVKRPEIIFSLDEIVYDEMDENPAMPKTQFTITSEAGLRRVELFLVSAKGQSPKGSMDMNGAKEYTYDELVEYVEGDKGFKVKAEDTYGNISISTLPVQYKVVPIPELEITKKDPIVTDSNVDFEIPVKATSIRGIKTVKLIGVEPDSEYEIETIKLNNVKDLNTSYKAKVNDNTIKVKVEVSDGREGKEVSQEIVTHVDMLVGTIQVGSQAFSANANPKYPDAFPCVSIKNMRSYSVDYAIESDAHGKDIDFVFYCFGGSGVPRLYGMHNQEKAAEFKGKTGNLKAMKVKNATAFTLNPADIDFNTATVNAIKKISPSVVSSSKLTPFEVGDVIAFRTGNSSHFGGGKVGIMKVLSMTAPKEVVSNNATARVMTIEIRFPKKK